MTQNFLEMRQIDKAFNGVPVLRGANFSLRRGECHALMGENGAGKSTLMKILTGVYSGDGGTITIDGKPVKIGSARDAEEQGIAMIFQEFSLIPTLTVAENIFLGREPRSGGSLFLSDREARRKATRILEELGETINPRTRVEDLSVGAKQMVEIAKAVSKNARILIMDEPTSSLSEREVETLFELVRKLKRNGISIVYISHRMAEIYQICDRITAMRDGRDTLCADSSDVTMEDLIRAMLGADGNASLTWQERPARTNPRPVLEVEDLSDGEAIEGITFSMNEGEIVGLAGLTGAGRTEIAEAIFGLRARVSGDVRIDGKSVRTVQQAIAAGAALVPEDRRTQGLLLEHSMKDNLILPNLAKFAKGIFVRDGAARDACKRHIAALRIKTDGPGKEVRLLSGGNQQKIVLAKWLERAPKLLILDEPTIGVDIGAKADLVQTIRNIADAGTAVLIISSEFEELLAVADRLLIIHDGQLKSELSRQQVATEEVLHHAVQG